MLKAVILNERLNIAIDLGSLKSFDKSLYSLGPITKELCTRHVVLTYSVLHTLIFLRLLLNIFCHRYFKLIIPDQVINLSLTALTETPEPRAMDH